MKYHVKERPMTDRYYVEAEIQPNGDWQLTDYAGAVTTCSAEDFVRFYEFVE